MANFSAGKVALSVIIINTRKSDQTKPKMETKKVHELFTGGGTVQRRGGAMEQTHEGVGW